MFFPNEGGFTLTNAMLFAGSAEVGMPTFFEPTTTAMGYGRLPWRATSRFARPATIQRQQGQHQQRQEQNEQAASPAIGRALLLAQTAASALCDPEMDQETFAMTIASALMGERPPSTRG
jgi:hypothetical protein